MSGLDTFSGRRVAGIGLAAAVCVAPVEPAFAQQTQLPTVNVEAPAAPKAKRRPQRSAQPQARTTPRPAASATAQPAVATPATTGDSAAANASPYANPGAPYKVERSASPRLTEALVNTPRTVTAIPKEVLEDKGATSVRELVRTTPGLTLGTGEGGNAFGDRVFIRGFDARNDMYINGVRESGVSTRETFMTEQVEVIKGPAGTIGGRGTAGGAINIVTKQPGPTNFAIFNTTIGTDLTKRQSADLNYNVNKDLSIRINGLFQQADVAGRNHVFDNRYGGSFAAAWKPTEAFKATLDYYGVYMDQMPDWGVPFDVRIRRPITESGLNRSNFYGVTSRDFQHNYQHMLTHGLEWKVDPNFSITNKFRFGYTVTDYVASKPGTPNLTNANPQLWTVAATPASRYQVNRTLANQTEATAKFDLGPFKHTVVTGLEAQREDISQDGYSGLEVECNPTCTTGITTNLWNPTTNLITAVGMPTRNGRPVKTKVNSLSAFVLDTMNWNDRLYLTLGGRADGYDITRTPFTGVQLSRSDLMFNWNAGVTYKVLPNASVYVAYATSTNPVGSELDGNGEDYGSLTAANLVFRPERNTSLEAGTKWELFDKKLLLTGAAFQTTKENARETIGTGPAAVLQDTAAYRIRGLEFGATGNITDRWSVFGGIVLMESKVTDSANIANRGRPLANIAHQSINLLTKYKLTDKFTLGGQATWKGEILGGTLAATYYAAGTTNVGGVAVPTPAGYNKLPAGWRFDVMAEYEIDKTFTLKAQVLNVFDKVLYDAFYRSNTPYVYVSPGRAGYLSLQAKF
ncbi:MAG: TonB-dependent siderophore receptor [Rhizobiales bacterium PAR1]|nr:MAG: TonB-dependent siderophore receptor [Rhizobiales bacterium PAR1]